MAASRVECAAFLGLAGFASLDARYCGDDPVGVREVAGIPATGGERSDVDADGS